MATRISGWLGATAVLLGSGLLGIGYCLGVYSKKVLEMEAFVKIVSSVRDASLIESSSFTGT